MSLKRVRSLIIHFSKSGHTKTNASFIAKELNLPPENVLDGFQIEKNNPESFANQFANAKVIIVGGSIRASSVPGWSSFFEKFPAKDKNIILYINGATPTEKFSSEQLHDLVEKNTSKDLKIRKAFYLHGGYDHNKTVGGDRMMMGTMKLFLKGKSFLTKLSENEQGMLKMFYQPTDQNLGIDNVEKIKEIVEYVRNGFNDDL